MPNILRGPQLLNSDSSKFEISNRLYERALESIPLASQTFSKSAMNFVRGASPLFLSRGEGAYVWDPDGNRYIDYILGLMPVVLGYRDIDVDNAIRDQLNKGIIFSLPAELEIELAEKLVEIIPSADMVRYGKNGSDVTTAAIRLARAFTGRDRVASCGYHGWHDWYIGTTSRAAGVPETVKALTSPFKFNDPNSLEELLRLEPDGFAAVILEPEGISEPDPEFLPAVRELTEKFGVVLIFDEIITGFRVSEGGAQEKYGVTPDLSVFGKALGNGMPISAVVGRRDIMALMTDIFFSGTFGGETLSLAAALATLNKLSRIDGPQIFRTLNGQIRTKLGAIIQDAGLGDEITIGGPNWWPRLILSPPEGLDQRGFASLLRQELVENGVLMGAAFNFCTQHAGAQVLDETFQAFELTFGKLKQYLLTSDPVSYLRGRKIQPVFQVREG
jgi:glutamate-1-semialdehyde 2,1-aminomutase